MDLVGLVRADHLQVRHRGDVRTVELLGIQAPDLKDSEASANCFARQAAEFVLRFLSDTTLVLERDPRAPDLNERGELLRYVYVQPGIRDLNAEMLRHGIAKVRPDLEFGRRQEFLALERQARHLDRGLWGVCKVSKAPEQNELGDRKLVDNAQEIFDELGRKSSEERQSRPHSVSAAPTGRGSAAVPSSSRTNCCKTCKKGKACGNSCISAKSTCRQPPGCACNG